MLLELSKTYAQKRGIFLFLAAAHSSNKVPVTNSTTA
jgi:hypothetical protein